MNQRREIKTTELKEILKSLPEGRRLGLFRKFRGEFLPIFWFNKEGEMILNGKVAFYFSSTYGIPPEALPNEMWQTLIEKNKGKILTWYVFEENEKNN